MLFVATLSRGSRADDETSIRGEVHRAALAVGTPSGDPAAPSFSLAFDLHLFNTGTKSIWIPRPHPGSSAATRTAILGVFAKGRDGRWVRLLRGSWYGSGKETYEPCVAVKPGGEGDIYGVKDGFVILGKQLAGLGQEPVLRLEISVFCESPRGTVATQELTTEAFPVRLP